MQRNRNIRLLILLVVLLAAVGVVYVFQQEDNPPVVDTSLFKVDDLAKIDGVILESRKGKIKLHYESTGWKVNDRFDADRQLITVLFATLEQMQPKRPVAANLQDSVRTQMDSSAVSVSLFEGPLLKKIFQAGGNAQSKESWFRLNKSTEAYLVTIPGYRVYVAQIFELDENGWRDKRIFDFNWRNFKTLTTTFPSDKSAGFNIGIKDSFFTIEGLEADTAKVNTYLDDLSLLRADQIVAAGFSKNYDSLVKTSPLMSIEISDIAGRAYHLSLFQALKKESQILGVAHDHDLVLFDREKVFGIFKKKLYFKQ